MYWPVVCKQQVHANCRKVLSVDNRSIHKIFNKRKCLAGTQQGIILYIFLFWTYFYQFGKFPYHNTGRNTDIK